MVTTKVLSKREPSLPVPRGWIVLGFVGLSWGLVAGGIVGFRALVEAVL